MNRSRLLLVAVALPLVLSACRKKTPPTVTPEPVPNAGPVTPVRNPEVPAATPDNGAAERERREREEAVRALSQTIYFEYNSDELRDDARTNLDAKVRLMAANPSVRIMIEGHCDERGDDEYNIVLGRRRAEAAKRYLTDRGVDAARVETVSFGRERPAVQGTGEEAWAQNRRDEVKITTGADQIRPAR
ncbi:MAG TPA: peptidoglycan-associated lipoprotein Pal [Gemmatimonas sp.]|nr:peptidoglycan-associated lipoprotein Pal [Gemmatimonas sp.]